jgi:hypothetical protein
MQIEIRCVKRKINKIGILIISNFISEYLKFFFWKSCDRLRPTWLTSSVTFWAKCELCLATHASHSTKFKFKFTFSWLLLQFDTNEDINYLLTN